MKMRENRERELKHTPARWLVHAGMALALLLALMAAPRVSAQNSSYSHPTFQQPIGQPGLAASPATGDDSNPQMQAKRFELLNANRQKSMVSDTDKLVKLAAKLNAEINGAHPVRLTEEQLRMVAEIEKLAHSVREKMSTPVRGTPGMAPSTVTIPAAPGLQ